MHGVVSNTVPRTTQGRFSMPQQLQSSRRRLEKKMLEFPEKKENFGKKSWAVKQKTIRTIFCKFAR